MEFSAVVAGDSHATCLGMPLFTENGEAKLVPLAGGDSRFRAVTGALRRDQAYWGLLAEAAVGKKAIIFWLGNQHLTSYLFAPTPPLDFFVADRPDLPIQDGALLVPEAAVAALLNPYYDHLHPLLDRLTAAGCFPVICGTPPPKGDNSRLRHLLASESYFIQLAAGMGVELADIELSNPLLRLKLWSVLQSTMRDVALAHNCPFVAVPASTQTAEGFLKDEYWSDDLTHANSAYGQVLLEHLVSSLGLE